MMKDDRFWKLVALSALSLFAISIFRDDASESRPLPDLLMSSAQADIVMGATDSTDLVWTTSNNGTRVYVWQLTARGPQLKWTADASF